MSISHEKSLIYCYQVLQNLLKITSKKAIPDPSLSTIPGNIPLFITIYTHGSEKRLRGCIGTFSPNNKTFSSCLEKYVHQAAFNDSRFSAFTANELLNNNVTLSLNVLHTFEKTDSWDDWEIGKHGTTIFFEDTNGYKRNATFLPAVAKEHKFSKEKAIEQLRRKAGGTPKFSGDAFLENLKVERYQSSEDSMSFERFCSLGV